MSPPDGENATPTPMPTGIVAGFAYLTPKPAFQGYTEINGLLSCATAMSEPDGEKATPFPVPVGKVAGSAYLVPNPEFHGYTETNGEVLCATAMSQFVNPPTKGRDKKLMP